jgi:1-acyl-sn-glycerol-3-phosphate acyltransferase
MTLAHSLVTGAIKVITGAICRVHGEDLGKVPDRGPLIIVGNHVNFLEVPTVYPRLHPRPLTGLAKVEAWDNPFLRMLADLWGAIPLHRGEADTSAIRQAIEALKEGYILPVSPEGTRSGDGRLLRGKPGIVLLALHSSAPLLPMVHWGGESIWHNLARLRRTDFHITVGRPFFLEPEAGRVTREVRQEMTDEIMYQLAALLPAEYRGVYSDLENATERYLRFPPGSGSNIARF